MNEPKDFSADRLLSQAQVNKAETIDAIFVKEKAEIVITYSLINHFYQNSINTRCYLSLRMFSTCFLP
jgi:hypothetical protein